MIIADEPTGNIDPKMSYEIMKKLVMINKRGTTVIVVTHDHELVRSFGGRVILIGGGEIIRDEIMPSKIDSDEHVKDGGAA